MMPKKSTKPLGPRSRITDKIETAYDHNTGNIIWYFDGKEGYQVKANFKKN